MALSATVVNGQITDSVSATDNLTAACQGILDTQMAPSSSHWYGTLKDELTQAQSLATEWQQQYASQLREDVLTCVIHCGQKFQAARAQIDGLFAEGPVAQLQSALGELKAQTAMISESVAAYEAGLRDWGQRLAQVHDAMSGTVHQVQSEAASLQAQIASINANIASMQAEIIRDRQAIARAKSERDKGIVKTIFGVVLAPFTGGLSLILAGIGVSSIVEAESKVSAMESTIRQYQGRIVGDQQNLNQDQAQLATLQGLLFSAGIALSDIEFGEQMLDAVRTTWDAFFQEMDGVISKIGHAADASSLVVERAWFNAACSEWDLIVTSTQGLIGETVLPSQQVTCGHCDVPVLRVVPTGSHPAVPGDMKVTVLADPGGLAPAPECQVLTWGPYTYWVASYVDNREAVCFLAYDAGGQVVKQVPKSGTRYPWKLVLDGAQQSLTCYGQVNAAVIVTLAELAIA